MSFVRSSSSSIRAASVLALALAIITGAAMVASCGGETESADPSAADGGGGSSDGQASTDAATIDGSGAVDGGTLGDASSSSSDGGGACAKDEDCNDNPSISPYQGRCFEGSCYCNKGLHVQPNGKCSDKVPGTCTEQPGGVCVQNSTCPAGNLTGDPSTNMSCGDFVAAVCCFAEASCKGSTNVGCCSKAQGLEPPICENGWRACTAGSSPMKKTDICN